MRISALVMALMILTGCFGGVDDSVLCERTDRPRTDHAAALATDGGPVSINTGRVLIATIDAGCG